MLSEWNVPPSAAESLVSAGLWARESSGFVFRNWLEYQPSKQDVDAERAASRERMRELRARRKQPKPQEDAAKPEVFGRTGPNGSENVRNPDPTRPDPTRPDPPRKKKDPSPPAVRVSESDFESAWAHWPKKVERKKSFEKFKAAAKTRGVTELVADIIRFGDAYARTTERQYTPALNVWLNGERWTDDLPTSSTDVINKQWDALMGETRDPCANGHKWVGDGSCARYPCPAIKPEE